MTKIAGDPAAERVRNEDDGVVRVLADVAITGTVLLVLLVAVAVGVGAGLAADLIWDRPRHLPATVGVVADVLAVASALVVVGRWVRSWIRRGGPHRDPGLTTAMRDRLAALRHRPATVKRRVATAVSLTVAVALSAAATLVLVNLGRSDEQRVRSTATDACQHEPAAEAIEVMVVWDDPDELGAFCEVVDEYRRRGVGDVDVVSIGERVGVELDERVRRGDPPDVAIVPQPSVVRELGSEGHLVPLDEPLAERVPAVWNSFVTEQQDGRGQPRVYGAFVKGLHKSLFWYRPVELGNAVGIEPEHWRWEQFTDWIDSRLRSGTDVPPLTLGAANRWPLGDWFENQFAGIAPDLYGDLARGRRANGDPIDWDAVRRAWDAALVDMAELWETSGLFAAGRAGEGAGTIRWHQMTEQLYEGDAEVMFGPSFLAGPVEEGREGNFRLHPFGFPTLSGGRPLIVGGDIAVLPRAAPHPAAAQEFVDWLTDEDAIDVWSVADPGYLTPNLHSPHLPDRSDPPDNEDNLRIWLTHDLRHPEDELHFDLSDDQLAAANRDHPHRNWDLFAEFFDDVTTGRRSRQCAVDRAIGRLEAEYNGQEWPSPPCR